MADGNGKVKAFFTDVKTHWKTPDTANGKYVPYKEYMTIFWGVGMNYGVQAPLRYITFGASCYLIMYHYNLPYLAFSIISLIGLPLSYMWNLVNWLVKDNLGLLEKKVERKLLAFYGSIAALGLLLLIFDVSTVMPASLVSTLNGLSGINAMSFFKIIGVQLFCNAYGGARDILWRKKLVPKFGRYKYILFANFIPKIVTVILIGWLPLYNIHDVNQRLWLIYLLFSLYGIYDFSNVIESCTQTISPNVQERLMVRTWPVKLAHLIENIFELLIPLIGFGFDDIGLYKWAVPIVFIPMAVITLISVKGINERIPQPPLEKKQKISFWYGTSQVVKNKYRWLNMFSGVIDSLGNGSLDVANVMFFFSMRLYTQGILYSILKLVYLFRSTPTSFIAPYFIKRFSFRSLKMLELICKAAKCAISISAIFLFRDRQAICGILILVSEFVTQALGEVSAVASDDMNIRLSDYQMYISGERLEGFSGIFGWFTGPVTTLVSLIIPLILLKNGFNSNWDVLFIDSTRTGILAVPMMFDLAGFLLMMIPYMFWDYNNEQHRYVMEVLKQREKLAYEGYFPQEYEGGLTMTQPEKIKNKIPVNSEEILEERAKAEG